MWKLFLYQMIFAWKHLKVIIVLVYAIIGGNVDGGESANTEFFNPFN